MADSPQRPEENTNAESTSDETPEPADDGTLCASEEFMLNNNRPDAAAECTTLPAAPHPRSFHEVSVLS